VLFASAVSGCVDRTRKQEPAPSGPDAGAIAARTAAVTAPATWNNLWGSWPLTRYSHAAAYDSDRKLLVVYGGQASTTVFYDDVWEWDAARGSWNQRTPLGDKAFTRSGHAMAYDPVAKKVFMFGGWQPGATFYITGQWEWDGAASAWTQRQITTAQPDPRHDHAMVYDSGRAKMVMFGGFGGPGTDDSNKDRLGDLWEWDPAAHTWSQPASTGKVPTPRYGHTMSYDSARKKVQVHGGNTAAANGTVNETYEWDTATGVWTQLATTGTAPPYSGSPGFDVMVYDASRSKTVLYEYGITTPTLVWELDLVTPAWTQIMTTRADQNTYPPSESSTLTYDSTQSKIVVFAGQSQVRQLWEYNGANSSWTNRSVPVNGPIQRTQPAVAYDNKNGKVYLFGGSKAGDTNPLKQDIWEWSGTDATWNSRTTPDTKPPPRYQSALCYDTKRDRLWLYGGNGNGALDDLWWWDPGTQVWTPVTPPGLRAPAMYQHLMFYDRQRDVLLVFNTDYQFWEYDPNGNMWKSRALATFPTGLTSAGFTYSAATLDYDRGKVVLVGGYAGGYYTTDLWEWDTTSGMWTERTLAAGAAAPSGRRSHAISYDSARRVTVLTGGNVQIVGTSGDANDSWEWDGAAGTWTETTPTSVKPLPRDTHLMVFDEQKGTTLVYGGNVPADTTYGPQEIWEYAPNSTPRPNGAACSAATAASCMSGHCVDGVCCMQASCPGMCQSCNVPGMPGSCANLPAGSPDDSCSANQACDASQQCKSSNGQACGSIYDCASGHCADGVCCDTDCNDTCKVCNLTGKLGTCSFVSNGDEDPNGVPACVSDTMQGRFCDGNGVCTNAPKPFGKPCTAGGQCQAAPGGNVGYCIDGVCCNSPCNMQCYACNVDGSAGTCSALPAGQQDHSAFNSTTGGNSPCDGTMQYCISGSCQSNKKPNGQTCATNSDCGSGFCTDGYCCNSACTGTCMACNVTAKLGSCVNIPAGSPDSNASTTCPLPEYCDGAGSCLTMGGQKANGFSCAMGTECASGFCADGLCCDQACTGTCLACNLPLTPGTCSLLYPGSVDPTGSPACTAPSYCAAGGACMGGRRPNGAACTIDNDCGSNYCVDGICCQTACATACHTCNNSTGTCSLTPGGMDPRNDCKGDMVGAICSGTCDGNGACRFPPQGLKCRDPGCQSDGYIGGAGMCNGAGHCDFMQTVNCNGFVCTTVNGMDTCKTDCATDPDCVAKSYCDQSQCPTDLPNGGTCNRDRQCQSGHCARANPNDATGVCCDRACDICGSCNMPGMPGTCVPAAAGTDPAGSCIDSASDMTGVCGGKCNGHFGCQFPPGGASCGQCKACDGSGKCNVMPADDPTCGDIDCDQLDNTCRDYHDIMANRCAMVGMCKKPNDPATCTDVTLLCDGGADDGGGAGDGAADAADGGMKKGGGGGCCSIGAGGGRTPLPLELGALAALMGLARRRRRR
jgi:hypothetical protein